MPDMTAIAAALTAFQTAKNIAQSMIGLRDAAAFQSKMIEFQSAILDAQSAAFAANDERSALIEKVSQLEKRVAEIEAWETEKQRYELKALGNHGVFAYALKGDAQNAEPPHHICPDCYQKGEKSILQQVTRFPGHTDVRLCQRCGWEVYITGGWQPEHSGKSMSRRR